MSSKGIYSALSGAMAQNTRLDTIANNIANVNTPGFKKDKQLFREYLTAAEKAPEVIVVPRVTASLESFYDLQGGDRGYVDLNGTATDFTQGGLKATGNSLDIAIEGKGFFEVLTPQGVRYTRNGALTIDTEGRLITKGGFLVLADGSAQADPSSRAIKVDSINLTITPNGEIFRGPDRIGKLSLVEASGKDALRKIGQSLYGLREDIGAEMVVSNDNQVHQGYLETSNVNVIQEMTEMIEASRAFEANQKAIKAYDQIDEKLVNEVPVLG